jgi:hypothetical protein
MDRTILSVIEAIAAGTVLIALPKLIGRLGLISPYLARATRRTAGHHRADGEVRGLRRAGRAAFRI